MTDFKNIMLVSIYILCVLIYEKLRRIQRKLDDNKKGEE